MKDLHYDEGETELKESKRLDTFDDSDFIAKFSLTILKIRCRAYFRAKYQTNQTTFDVKVSNDLIFNEKCKIVALFKDYLILDDTSEFLRRFYAMHETLPRLVKILQFYETYSKIFPNYIIMPESVYLYKNIRKKQKMIDACNQIKLEEEENRKQIGNVKQKGEKEERVFDSSIMESIFKCQPSLNNGHQDSILITSFTSRKVSKEGMSNVSPSKSLNYNKNLLENEESSISIAKIVNMMDRSKLGEYCEKEHSISKEKQVSQKHNVESPRMKNCNGNEQELVSSIPVVGMPNNNKKFIVHKVAASVPEFQGGGIKIINHFQNIILPQGSTVISISNNFFNYDPSEPNRLKNSVQPCSPQILHGKKNNTNKVGSGTKNFNINFQPSKLEPKDATDDNPIVYSKTEANADTVEKGCSSIKPMNTLSNDYLVKIYINKMNQILQHSKSPQRKCFIPQKTTQLGVKAIPHFKEPHKTINYLPITQSSVNSNKTKSTGKMKFRPTSKSSKANQMKFIKTTYLKKNEIINYTLDYDKNNPTKMNPILLTEPNQILKVNMHTENSKSTEKTKTMLSKNEMKQKYKIFLEKNKMESLTSRNSTETGNFRQRMSIQVANLFNARNSGFLVNQTQNATILTPLAKQSNNIKSSLKNQQLLSPENDHSTMPHVVTSKNAKIVDLKKMPKQAVKGFLSPKNYGILGSKNTCGSVQADSQQKNRIKKITLNSNVVKSLDFQTYDPVMKKMKFLNNK